MEPHFMECSGVTEPNSALHRAEILRSPKVLESIAAPTYLRPHFSLMVQSRHPNAVVETIRTERRAENFISTQVASG